MFKKNAGNNNFTSEYLKAIKLQIGNCGNVVGSKFWNQLCDEHAIEPDGRKNTGKGNNNLIDEYLFREKDKKGTLYCISTYRTEDGSASIVNRLGERNLFQATFV